MNFLRLVKKFFFRKRKVVEKKEASFSCMTCPFMETTYFSLKVSERYWCKYDKTNRRFIGDKDVPPTSFPDWCPRMEDKK